VAERKPNNKVFDQLFKTAHEFIAYPRVPKPKKEGEARKPEAT